MYGSDADDGSGVESPAEGATTDGGGGSGVHRHGSGVDATSLPAAVDEAAAATPTVSRATVRNADDVARSNRIASVLVGVGSGPHSGATVDLARRLATAADAWLELFHVATDDPTADGVSGGDAADVTGSEGAAGSRAAAGGTGGSDGSDAEPGPGATAGRILLETARDRIDGFDRADTFLVEADSAATTIAEQSRCYDLVVVGATTTGTVGRLVFGSTTDAVIDGARVPVVVVEADGPTPLR